MNIHKIKRIIAAGFMSSILVLPTACGKQENINASEVPGQNIAEQQISEQNIQEQVSEEETSEISLTNQMSDNEKSRVSKHELTLLDEPTQDSDKPEWDPTGHTVSVEERTTTPEEEISKLEKMRDNLPESDYQDMLESYQAMEPGAVLKTQFVLLDGKIMEYTIPDTDFKDDIISISEIRTDSEGNETEIIEKFSSLDDYLDWVKKDCIENKGYSESAAELMAQRVKYAYETIQNGEAEILPQGTVNPSDPSLYSDLDEEVSDYRSEWEYDRTEVEKIKDSIEEINIYDDELDTEFLVHVTLPPNYDKDKTYPVFFLTDGVWRFGNHTSLRKVMEDGEASEVILVSLGYNYHMNGADGNIRGQYFVQKRALLLDFITNNLMPYLGENYKIDYENSTLYGHSDGGVFAHYALFNSDNYENQPFGRYIIGSPAFWGLYDIGDNLDAEGCETDYGYFDRHETLNKKVFLCGGSEEDPDYEASYKGHASTLQGLDNLKKRLESHGADVTCKLYESHHYQYIPDMLVEYLKEAYPPQ